MTGNLSNLIVAEEYRRRAKTFGNRTFGAVPGPSGSDMPPALPWGLYLAQMLPVWGLLICPVIYISLRAAYAEAWSTPVAKISFEGGAVEIEPRAKRALTYLVLATGAHA